MKVSLVYPKIPGPANCPLKKCVVFEKYDGTNLHWIWNADKGWTHFGTRRDQFELSPEGIASFNEAHPGLECAVPLFQTIYSQLGEYPIAHKYGPYSPTTGNVILFTEYLGKQSFAGGHQADDPKKLVLIDISVDLYPIVSPTQFVIDFGQFDDVKDNPSGTKITGYNLARILFTGKYSGQLVEDIRNGKYLVKEGAVIKGTVDDQVYMCKVKTNAYLDKLKSEFGDGWEEYGE